MKRMNATVVRASTAFALAAVLLMVAAPAHAQYRPRPIDDPATGESYHIEGSIALWYPSATMGISSESLGIQGSQIDLKNDLGLADQKLPEFSIVFRPFRHHKLRFDYIPISYTQGPTTLSQDIVFNGQRYQLGVPVNSTLDWKAYRFGYEFDFITRNRGFAGFITEAKYTDVRAEIDSPILSEFAQARAPIPAIGGIGRYYVVPNISVTGELTAFKLPSVNNGEYQGHYVDFDIYGTVNANNYVGVKAGYRSLDTGYVVKKDSGSFVLNGFYIGAVVRY
jgi:hypothetical protein